MRHASSFAFAAAAAWLSCVSIAGAADPPPIATAETPPTATAETPPTAKAADASPRAAYANTDALKPEGVPHQVELAMGAQWLHLSDRERPNGLRNVETFVLSERTLLGRTVAYCAGLDAHVGGSDTGAAYGATLYALGLGVRAGRGAFVAACGGVGGDRIVGSVPFGARFPAEILLGFPLGPFRPTAFARASWIANASERRHGSPTVYAFDELEAGLSIRLGRQRRYWTTVNAGNGFALGVVYRELMGARAIGAVLSFDLSAGE